MRHQAKGRRRALPTLALVFVLFGLAGVALAASTPNGGSYSGSTSRGKQFGLKVGPGHTKVSRITFTIRSKCRPKSQSGTQTWVFGAPGRPAATIHNGRFSTSESGVSVGGHFTSATRAQGFLHQHIAYSTPGGTHVVCTSGKTTWTAQHD